MTLFGKTRQALAAHRAANRALRENRRAEQAAGIDYDTEDHRRLIRDVWEAEGALPWWLRWWLS